ncbi:adenine phosphoribosyltransferase-like [Ylistrum balloti]|uniref:adenine phosphoribosyltransferase-like n=1 Tax=Ylistrum balloti TaxID=509963 RepID=UPI0029059F0A|nr:adenine phosphoribosyltransferase-like [Ylistrum balloti]
MDNGDLLEHIRLVPDFPKPGIMFYDITTLLQQPYAFKETIERIANSWKNAKIDTLVAIDARGFLLGSALAYKLGVGLTLVRKANKLPFKTISTTYDLEYASATLEMHVDACQPGQRVLIVDDLLATGGTVAATIKLVKQYHAQIIGCSFLLELMALNGREQLGDLQVKSLIQIEA